MGNGQDKVQKEQTGSVNLHGQQLTVTAHMLVIENQEHKHMEMMQDILSRINMNHSRLIRLRLLYRSRPHQKVEGLHLVKPMKMRAEFAEQIRSEIQLLSYLSSTFCRQLSENGVSCWLTLTDRHPRGYGDRSPSDHKLGVDHVSFGTLESAVSFVTVSTSGSSAITSAVAYELEFRHQDKKIYLWQTTETTCQRLFRVEIEYKHLHRTVHVVRREEHFDAYFQLRQPPALYECINVDAAEENRRFSRRSFAPGVPSEEIGRCDVLRVSFRSTVSDKNLFSYLFLLMTHSPQWELRFTWIRERKIDLAAFNETKVYSSFDVLYASKVLDSVGLRCQLIDCSELLQNLPNKVHADVLYSIADRYESESEYYLIDATEIIRKRKRSPKTNSKPDSKKMRNVILTPTRIIFRRPSDCESNRVFRDYFSDDHAEYAMKVYFRDEDIQSGQKNLHFIPLWFRNCSLDDQVMHKFKFAEIEGCSVNLK